MGNQRQRLAKKKFIAAGGLPSAPLKRKREPTCGEESSEGTKNKKKKKNEKKQRPVDGAQKGDVENGGEENENLEKKPTKGKLWRLENFDRKTCHFCKGTDHIKSKCPNIEAKKMCLLCRKWGHSIQHCPENVKGDAGVPEKAAKVEGPACYNCGKNGHRLADCSQPLKDGGAAFATCFICNQRGHLSKACPSNDHGIYPKGGCCKVCGEVTHLAKDCPQKVAAKKRLSIPGKDSAASTLGPGSKRVVLQSGDDLDDDYGATERDDGGEDDVHDGGGYGDGVEVEELADDEKPEVLGENGRNKKRRKDGKDKHSGHKKASRAKGK